MVAGDVQNGISIIQLNGEEHHGDYEFEKKEERQLPAADVEDALAATGFGLYNIMLVLAALPVAWASAFDMTTSAFILASAECDLKLTYIRKAALCCFPYLGMMVSSFFWGFLTDRINRRPLMLLGLFIDAACNIVCCVIESYHVFLLMKFITGTIVSGPFALVIPYVNEFQPVNYRQKFITWSGLIFNIGFVVPAILAFNITPKSWSFTLLDHEYTSWRIYLMICTLPSIIGLVTMCLSPESPKRLMENGRPSSAHDVLRRMYVVNNFKSAKTYLITNLHVPKCCNDQIKKANFEKIKDTWSDIKQLFSRPYLDQFVVINFLHFGSILGFNTMRLWIPHMFVVINNFDADNWDWSRGFPTLCDYLNRAVIPEGPTNDTIYGDNCVRWIVRPIIYMNSSAIAASAVGFAFLFSLYYTTQLRKKVSLTFCYATAVVSSLIANWLQLVPIMLTFCAAIVVTGRISGNIVIGVNAKIIPLSLRNTAVNFVTNVGNFATVIGNIIFVTLLEIECLSAFMGITCLMLLCLVTSFFTLNSPREVKKETNS